MDNKIIKQHNAITTARYDMTAAEKNIVYMMLAQLEDNDPVNKVYRVQVRDLEKTMNVELKYNQLKEATDRLITRLYGIKNDTKLHQVSLLTSARHKKGGGVIELRLSKNIRPYFFQLKNNFTIFQLHMALSLKSKFSKRIYEILSQYKDTGTLYTTVEDFKLCLGLIDPETGEEQYKNFNDFEKRVLLVAQQELEKSTDINFTYVEKKTRKKVTDLIFLIKYKPKKELTEHKIEDTSTNELRNRLLNKFRLSPWQAQLVLKGVSVQEISKTLYDVILKLSDGKIKNVGGFTAKIFDNKYNLGLFSKNVRSTKN